MAYCPSVLSVAPFRRPCTYATATLLQQASSVSSTEGTNFRAVIRISGVCSAWWQPKGKWWLVTRQSQIWASMSLMCRRWYAYAPMQGRQGLGLTTPSNPARRRTNQLNRFAAAYCFLHRRSFLLRFIPWPGPAPIMLYLSCILLHTCAYVNPIRRPSTSSIDAFTAI